MKDKENKQETAKPIIILKKEFEESITHSINNSNLPAFIIEPILADLLSQTRKVAQLEYEETLKQYNNSILKVPANN